MTALGIRYLTGCAVASNTMRRYEFPPHFGRVFMAMAAAHFETRGDAEERRALEWIESQDTPPSIKAPEFWERKSSNARLPLESFVPVNDEKSAVAVVARGRQPRPFPTVRLGDDKVFFVWDTDAPEDIRAALDRLCSKVTRIGHSSSLVQMWVPDKVEEIDINLGPDEFSSDVRMRVAESGTLAYLERAFAQGDGPRLARWQGYRKVKEQDSPAPDQGPFDSRLIILEKVDGRVLGLESTMQLTSALRNAAMKALPEGESPEWLSGHQSDGTPSLKPHAAFFPLPFVDARYADGHVLGLAIAIPRFVAADIARRTLGALLFNPDSGEERTIRLWRNDVWEWKLRREMRDYPPVALRMQTWTEASCAWASVTPVVLHHHPKKNRSGDVERILYEAFASAGLPAPKSVRATPVSPIEGAPHARLMPEFAEGGANLCRYQTHVVVVFEKCLQGPVLVGRGRFRGYGLFRPLKPGIGAS